nr:hypothetical protein [Corynebacterium bovis]
MTRSGPSADCATSAVAGPTNACDTRTLTADRAITHPVSAWSTSASAVNRTTLTSVLPTSTGTFPTWSASCPPMTDPATPATPTTTSATTTVPGSMPVTEKKIAAKRPRKPVARLMNVATDSAQMSRPIPRGALMTSGSSVSSGTSDAHNATGPSPFVGIPAVRGRGPRGGWPGAAGG